MPWPTPTTTKTTTVYAMPEAAGEADHEPGAEDQDEPARAQRPEEGAALRHGETGQGAGGEHADAQGELGHAREGRGLAADGLEPED